MGSYLNLIGSIIIGGIFLMMINNYNNSLSQTSHERTLDGITIYHANQVSKLIEYDFNKMGLRVPPSTTIIKRADSSQITFLADINNNGAIDSVRYILSVPDSASGTVNPRDRILYRLVNNEAMRDATLGVTRFRIRYFDWLGNITTDPKLIRNLEVTLRVESIVPYDTVYSAFHWQTKITPPNLARF